MKFQIRVGDKDSVANGLCDTAVAALDAAGYTPEAFRAKWYNMLEKKVKELNKLVSRFLVDGNGGNDSVTVEFDTDAETCIVIPVRKK